MYKNEDIDRQKYICEPFCIGFLIPLLFCPIFDYRYADPSAKDSHTHEMMSLQKASTTFHDSKKKIEKNLNKRSFSFSSDQTSHYEENEQPGESREEHYERKTKVMLHRSYPEVNDIINMATVAAKQLVATPGGEDKNTERVREPNEKEREIVRGYGDELLPLDYELIY